MVIAFAICVVITIKYAPKNLLTSQDIYNFCLLTMAALLFGPKLMELLMHGPFNLNSFLDLLKFWERGNFSFFPAFILAVVLIFIYCRIKKVPLFEVMDYLLPIAILGVSIHRSFACFLAGCCYGKPTDLPCGLIFPETSRAGRHFPGIAIHPTQLYYGITALLIFIFLIWYKRQSPVSGKITALGLFLLGSSYFFITFFRGDIAEEQVLYHLSHSQYFSISLFVAGFALFIWTGCRRKK